MYEDLGNHLKDQLFHLVHWWNISQNSDRDKARIHQIGKKLLPGILIGPALIAVRIWKGDLLIADIEELENLDASDIHPRRLNAKEVLRTKNGEFVFPVADGSANLSGTDCEFQEPTPRRESTVRRGNLSRESQGDREEFRPEESKDDEEVHKDFWSIQGDSIYRQRIEPRIFRAERRIISHPTEIF